MYFISSFNFEISTWFVMFVGHSVNIMHELLLFINNNISIYSPFVFDKYMFTLNQSGAKDDLILESIHLGTRPIVLNIQIDYCCLKILFFHVCCFLYNYINFHCNNTVFDRPSRPISDVISR